MGPVDLSESMAYIAQIPSALVLDAKALWDSLSRSERSALGMRDKRTAIDAYALKRALLASDTKLAWVHSLAQLADSMTKDTESGRTALRKVLSAATHWRLVYGAKFTSALNRAKQGLAAHQRETKR